MIAVTSPASTYDLTTLHAVKEFLGITSADNDALLATLITRASSFVSRKTEKVFAREEVTETIEGSGRVELVLSRTPIVSVTAAKLDGEAQDNVLISDRNAGLIFQQVGFTRQEISLRRVIEPWPSGSAVMNWEIDYIGGYWLPGFIGSPGSNDVLLPSALEQLVMEIIQAWYSRRGSLGLSAAGKKSERIGDYSVTYSDSLIPKSVLDDLELNWSVSVL